jgi:hypothetical protein
MNILPWIILMSVVIGFMLAINYIILAAYALSGIGV